jgi:hypothetical protein
MAGRISPASRPESSLFQIRPDETVVLQKLLKTFKREEMNFVVNHLFLRRVSATILRKEAVGQYVSHIIDTSDGARNILRHCFDGMNNGKLFH